MPFAARLRKLEQVFALLAWGSFGLGALAFISLCVYSLLLEQAPAPENFLARLGVVLGATLVLTIAFRTLAWLCRWWRARVRTHTTSRIGPFVPFEDSTLGS